MSLFSPWSCPFC